MMNGTLLQIEVRNVPKIYRGSEDLVGGTDEGLDIKFENRTEIY